MSTLHLPATNGTRPGAHTDLRTFESSSSPFRAVWTNLGCGDGAISCHYPLGDFFRVSGELPLDLPSFLKEFERYQIAGSWDDARDQFSHKLLRAMRDGVFRLEEGRFVRIELASSNGSKLVFTGNYNVTAVGPTRQSAEELYEMVAHHLTHREPVGHLPGFFVISGLTCSSRQAIWKPEARAPAHSASRLRLLYGDAFVQWERALVRTMRQRKGGLIILRGPPGTGKTSLLRHLMRRLYRTHCFYYFPPEKRSYIDAADLDELWAEQSQKYPSMQPVIMIEDAEQLLMSRGNDNRSAVSSLLEETDGLIRDAYNHQIICTVNCPLDSVDPAIIRPGRLLADWQFRPLSRAEATRLIAARRLNVASKDEMTLAEIFHPVGALNDTLLARIRQHIGFAVPS